MNSEQDRIKQMEARLQKLADSIGMLRGIVAVLVILVIGLLFAIQEIRRDIPQPVLLAVAIFAVVLVLKLVFGKHGLEERASEEKDDQHK